MMSRLRAFATQHPKLTAWIALAIGMVIILILAARDVGLLWNQWLFLILATIGLAGLCVWIIGWEANNDESDSEAASNSGPKQPQTTAKQPSPKSPSPRGVTAEAKETAKVEK